MEEVKVFYNTDPDAISDDINDWLKWFREKRPDMKIFFIKQTALAPDAVIVNPDDLISGDSIEREAFLFISIWYGKITEHEILKKFDDQ